MRSLAGLISAASALLALATVSSATPLFDLKRDLNASLPELLARAPPSDLQLNLLPIGDSLTAGFGSSTANAYRLNLKFFIQAAGWPVDFRGTQSLGSNNPDNQHEGYGGFRINMILDKIRQNKILSEQPNLILIHAGTNDNNGEADGESFSDAPERYGKMIDYITCRVPNAVVLVAKLVRNNYNLAQGNAFNDKVPGLVFQRQAAGQKVQLVDMSVIGDTAEMFDSVHPNDDGYYRMAQIWYDAIINIPQGWWSVSDPNTFAGREQYCRDRGIV